MRHTFTLVLLLALLATPTHAEQIVKASYAQPVERYGHFALGKPHEHARVEATTDSGREVALDLPQGEVFEDLAPRLVVLPPARHAQLLVIVSAQTQGARLALLGLKDGKLGFVANADPIGTQNRWLNPVGVANLDGDGVTEIAIVTTPHIGGVLRIYRQSGARLTEVASLQGFSNHVYGSAELGLSRPALIAGRSQLLVPDGARANVRAIALSAKGLVETARCALPAPITNPEPLSACEASLNNASAPPKGMAQPGQLR